MRRQHTLPTLLAIALASTALTGQAAAFQKLDKFLPAKIAGWTTDRPSDPDGMVDHVYDVNQTFSSKNREAGLDVTIQRVRPDSPIGLPELDKARLGPLPQGGGFVSMQTVSGRKAVLNYDAPNKHGNLTIVAGRCVVMVNGRHVTEAQLLAAAGAVDLKGLDGECK